MNDQSDSYHYRVIARAIELIENSDGNPINLDTLASSMGMSTSHFQRVFFELGGDFSQTIPAIYRTRPGEVASSRQPNHARDGEFSRIVKLKPALRPIYPLGSHDSGRIRKEGD